VAVSVLRPRPGPHVAPTESVTWIRTRVLDEGRLRLFLFLPLSPPQPFLVLVRRTGQKPLVLPTKQLSILGVSFLLRVRTTSLNPSTAFVCTYIYTYIRWYGNWSQWCIYEWCMLVFSYVLSKSGVGTNRSGDVDDCDDDNDGRQQFRIPTTAICFGTEHDDNGHK